MQATYHIRQNDFDDSFVKVVKELFKSNEKLTITITTPDLNDTSASEKEKVFYSLFGSWEGDETGDELVNKIYADRVNSVKDLDL